MRGALRFDGFALTPGNILRLTRFMRGLTQAEVGKYIGVSAATINGYESGLVQLSDERLGRILKELCMVVP